jgi:hypothetical protein
LISYKFASLYSLHDDNDEALTKELLRELAALGVDVEMLRSARLSQDELRGLLTSLRRLLKIRRT